MRRARSRWRRRRCAVSALAVAAPVLAAPAGAGAQATPQPPSAQPAPFESFTTDAPVQALAKRGNRVFLGGAFTRIGPITGGGVLLDGATGARDTRFPRVGGIVFAVLSDDAGGFYIGGRFRSVDGVQRGNLAHILPDGSVDPAFAPRLDREVLALAKSADRLYVGGNFVFSDTTIRRRLLALDRATGQLVGGFNPGVDGTVEDLAVAGDKLFVSGRFRGISGKSRQSLAAVDATTGALDPTFDAPPDGPVDALLVSFGRLYVGGAFQQIGGRSRAGLAAFDLATGELDRAFSPSTDGYVFGLTTDGNRLFVAGHFGQVARAFNAKVASVDPTTGDADPAFRLFANTEDAFALGVSGNRLYIGGAFSKVNEQPQSRLAAVDTATGALDASFDVDPDGDVYALALSGSQIYAGGTFTSAPRIEAPGLATVDATTGAAIPYAGGVQGTVSALALSGSRLIAGGRFRSASGSKRLNLAAFDVDSGALDDLDVPVNGPVGALAAVGRRLFVGGDYEKIGGDAHTSLAALDVESGAVEAGFNPAPKKVRGRRGEGRFDFADIATLLPTKDRLLVGGEFTTTGKRPRAGLVGLRLRDSALDRRFDAQLQGNRSVNALARAGKTLYVGGSFSRIVRYVKVRKRGKVVRRPVLRSGLVALDAATGRAQPRFDAGTGDFESVDALALRGSQLVVGGQFTTLARRRRDSLASVDAATGRPSATFTPQPFAVGTGDDGLSVAALLLDGDRLYVGGQFSYIGSGYQPRFAMLPAPPS